MSTEVKLHLVKLNEFAELDDFEKEFERGLEEGFNMGFDAAVKKHGLNYELKLRKQIIDLMLESRTEVFGFSRKAKQLQAVILLIQDYNCGREKNGHDGTINLSLQAANSLASELIELMERSNLRHYTIGDSK